MTETCRVIAHILGTSAMDDAHLILATHHDTLRRMKMVGLHGGVDTDQGCIVYVTELGRQCAAAGGFDVMVSLLHEDRHG